MTGTLMGWRTFGPRGGVYTGGTYTVYRFRDDVKFMIGAADLKRLLLDHHLAYVRVNESGFIDVAFDADHEALMSRPGERRLSR